MSAIVSTILDLEHEPASDCSISARKLGIDARLTPEMVSYE